LVSLEHLFDDTPSSKVEETKVELSDELAALDHLFEDAPVEPYAPAEVMLEPEAVTFEAEEQEPAESSDISNELASLDHLFDDLPTEETKKTDEIEFDLADFNTPDTAVAELEVAEPEVEIATEDGSEVDFTAELGLLDEGFDTIPTAEPEFEVNLAPEQPVEAVVAVEPVQEQASTPATGGEDDEFGFLAGADEAATKLDLAKAYIDMEDIDGAKDILQEVLQEGNAAQQQEAKDLLARL
jgi:pilus assembly protein FimV